MFKEKDGDDLREELGLSDERAKQLLKIVRGIMDQEAPNGEYGRTSHILLNIAGRKDLNDVEKAACVFLFSCKALSNGGQRSSRGISISGERSRQPGICIPHMSIPEGEELIKKEFIDIEGGASGMIIAPEGVGPEETTGMLMAILMSMLRQMSKNDAQEFCRHASLSFAKIAMTGDVRL